MDLTAVVSSASGGGDLWSPGHDGTRARGANRLARPREPLQLSACPRAGQSRCAILPLSRCSLWLVHRSISDLLDGYESAVSFPDGPGDSSELVCESDGCFVVPTRTLTFESPGSQSIGMIDVLCRPEDGACAMNEEHSEIGVAAFGDAAEMAS